MFSADTEGELVPQSDPGMLFDDTAAVCRGFVEALEETGALEQEPAGSLGAGDFRRMRYGARELLRQAAYYAMKRRAGTVGRYGLGPALGEPARLAPDVRVHLVGHGPGARLVSFALPGLPTDVRNARSVTLLQAAFSHYAFTGDLPHESRAGGVLHDQQRKVRGPLVCCCSEHDTALRVFHPLASRLVGDSSWLLGDARKWGALGYDGVHRVGGTVRATLAQALERPLPASGCVNVDASAVVRRGGPPRGAPRHLLSRAGPPGPHGGRPDRPRAATRRAIGLPHIRTPAPEPSIRRCRRSPPEPV